jgi:hypothetical protein
MKTTDYFKSFEPKNPLEIQNIIKVYAIPLLVERFLTFLKLNCLRKLENLTVYSLICTVSFLYAPVASLKAWNYGKVLEISFLLEKIFKLKNNKIEKEVKFTQVILKYFQAKPRFHGNSLVWVLLILLIEFS